MPTLVGEARVQQDQAGQAAFFLILAAPLILIATVFSGQSIYLYRATNYIADHPSVVANVAVGHITVGNRGGGISAQTRFVYEREIHGRTVACDVVEDISIKVEAATASITLHGNSCYNFYVNAEPRPYEDKRRAAMFMWAVGGLALIFGLVGLKLEGDLHKN